MFSREDEDHYIKTEGEKITYFSPKNPGSSKPDGQLRRSFFLFEGKKFVPECKIKSDIRLFGTNTSLESYVVKSNRNDPKEVKHFKDVYSTAMGACEHIEFGQPRFEDRTVLPYIKGCELFRYIKEIRDDIYSVLVLFDKVIAEVQHWHTDLKRIHGDIKAHNTLVCANADVSDDADDGMGINFFDLEYSRRIGDPVQMFPYSSRTAFPSYPPELFSFDALNADPAQDIYGVADMLRNPEGVSTKAGEIPYSIIMTIPAIAEWVNQVKSAENPADRRSLAELREIIVRELAERAELNENIAAAAESPDQPSTSLRRTM